MKKIFFLCFILLALRGIAQDCKGYYYLQNNRKVEMTIYNKKGEVTGKQVLAITDVKENGGILSATLSSEMFDKKGKSIAKGNNTVQCNNGIMMMDIKMFMPQQQADMFKNAEATASNVYIEYPATMKLNDILKDASFVMEMSTNGLKQTLSMQMTNRTVTGKETVTTAAGTWDCFIIAYKSDINIKTMGIGIPMNADITEWYAPGFGVVKTESKYGGTAITAIQ